MCNRLIYFSLQNPFWGLDLLNKVTWMWLVGLIVFQCSSSLDPYVPFWSSKPEQKQAVYWSLKVRRIRLLKHFFSLKQTDLFQLKPIEPIKKSHSIEQELQWEAQTVSFKKFIRTQVITLCQFITSFLTSKWIVCRGTCERVNRKSSSK